MVVSLAPAAGAQTPGDAPSSTPAKGPIRQLLDDMTLEEKVGQMFMVHGFGTSLNDPDPAMIEANQDLYGVDDFEGLIDKYHVGGIIYFGFSNNVDSPQRRSIPRSQPLRVRASCSFRPTARGEGRDSRT